MPKVMANGINLHYMQVGEGPDLVMLHGLMGNLAVWHLRMIPLLRTTFRTTSYDLRGHGRSDMPPSGYSTGELAEDLCGLLDALGIERTFLLGHSMGADVALHFALRYPDRVRKLVLIEAGIPALVHMRKDEHWEGWRYWADIIETYTGQPVPPEKRTDLSYMVRLSLDTPILYGPARGLPRKKEPMLRLLETTSLIRDYEEVDGMTLANIATIVHPTLLVYDSGSPYIGTYRMLRDTLPNSASLILPEAELRHFSPLEQPELLVDEVNAFLQPAEVEQGSMVARQPL